MSITLPIEPQRWPLIRILHREKWGGKATSGGGWKTLPMVKHGQKLGGFELINCSRALLPQIGRATLQFQFGRFGNTVLGANQETRDRLSATGGPWIPGSDALEILPDLKGHEIRIQAARDTGSGNGTYRTIWWGYVDYVEDTGWPGAAVPSGTRTYHCVDAFWRTKNWIMDKHGVYTGSIQQGNLRGHPGYNVSDVPGLRLGNKETSGATYATDGGGTSLYHTWPGAGNEWTDRLAIENALAAARPADEPLWTMAGAVDLFGSSSAWRVGRGTTVFDFVANICRRGRGRGAVLPTWADDSGDATGALTCELRSFAQVANDISYTRPAAGGTQSISGAATDSTQLAIDLIGDHRVVDGSLKLGDAEKYRVDYLESEGEPIEVMVTLGQIDGTLAEGWLAAEATAFAALDPEERLDDRWNPVYALQRLSRSFIGSVGNGNGGGNSTAAWSCGDLGAINLGTANRAASVLVTEVLNDLPLYEGYNYAGTTPARYDAQSAGAFAGQPSRKQAGIYFRTADDRYRKPEDEEVPVPVRLQFVRDGFMVSVPTDQGSGYRTIGDEAVATLNSTYTWSKVVLTVGLRLANPVRMATGNPSAATRSRMVIRHDDLHLWLAHPGAIWDLDGTTGDSDGYTPRRSAGNATPGLLRDDRDALAYRHNLAVAWYGPHLTNKGNVTNSSPATRRQTASWALRDCCFLGTFLDKDGTSHSYPALGWLLYSLTTNGQVLFPNTPFSSMSYDHTTGTTEVVTDWADLEFE